MMDDLKFNIINQILGWTYFVAWSISFYPQVFTNFKRKSVIGLNFDFVLLNLVGFLCYSIFNVAIFVILTSTNVRSPIEINDIVFSIHAFLLTSITGLQAIIYERGNQRISTACRCILGICFCILICCGFLFGFHRINTFQFLYAFSYVKLFITLIKYTPQAYMNFVRKSTIGWNIWGVILDTTGGLFSLAQMILVTCYPVLPHQIAALNSHNSTILMRDNWSKIFDVEDSMMNQFLTLYNKPSVMAFNGGIVEGNCVGRMVKENPVKMFLSLMSMTFDLVFYLQHFLLYRQSADHARYENLINPNLSDNFDDNSRDDDIIETGNVEDNSRPVIILNTNKNA